MNNYEFLQLAGSGNTLGFTGEPLAFHPQSVGFASSVPYPSSNGSQRHAPTAAHDTVLLDAENVLLSWPSWDACQFEIPTATDKSLPPTPQFNPSPSNTYTDGSELPTAHNTSSLDNLWQPVLGTRLWLLPGDSDQSSWSQGLDLDPLLLAPPDIPSTPAKLAPTQPSVELRPPILLSSSPEPVISSASISDSSYSPPISYSTSSPTSRQPQQPLPAVRVSLPTLAPANTAGRPEPHQRFQCQMGRCTDTYDSERGLW